MFVVSYLTSQLIIFTRCQLQAETNEQKKIIKIFEERFEAKGQNIPELNAKVEEAEKKFSQIEEREKRFVTKETINNLLREENDNLRIEEKRLHEEIRELKQAFEMYELQCSAEKVDMTYFLSKLRETVKLNNRIAELEKTLENKGYITNIAQAENDLREKEKSMELNTETLNHIVAMLKNVMEEKELDIPRIVGKLEESVIVFAERAGINNDERKNGMEIDIGDVSPNNSNESDNGSQEDDEISLNTPINASEDQFVDEAKCAGVGDIGVGYFYKKMVDPKIEAEILTFARKMKSGLESIKKEGMLTASDLNAFCAVDIDERDDCEVTAAPSDASR